MRLGLGGKCNFDCFYLVRSALKIPPESLNHMKDVSFSLQSHFVLACGVALSLIFSTCSSN